MIYALTSQPVDWIFAAVGTLVLAGMIWTNERAVRRDPWRVAVLTSRARDHGRKVRARRRRVLTYLRLR